MLHSVFMYVAWTQHQKIDDLTVRYGSEGEMKARMRGSEQEAVLLRMCFVCQLSFVCPFLLPSE